MTFAIALFRVSLKSKVRAENEITINLTLLKTLNKKFRLALPV